MWWRWLIVVLASLDAISSQPLAQQISDAHAPIECCPCPGSERAALDTLSASSQSTGGGVIGRDTDVDDCPCRVRDADSDGAPSALLPRVLHPHRPDVKPRETNEDVKPLLHPEVDLASSVLETLREATEEEYQEALVRDAARSSAKGSEDESSHGMTDPENTDIVKIIVNPKAAEEEDIIISEASHVKESRCAHPLGSSRKGLGQVRSKTPLLHTKGLLRLPKFESKGVSPRPFDMYNSASNVDERVVTANRRLEGLKLKSSPSKLSEFLERAKLKLSETSNTDGTKNFISPKVPNFRFDSLLKKKNEQIGFKINEKKVGSYPVDRQIFPKINLSRGKSTVLDSLSDLDSITSPSIVHEQLSKSFNEKPEKIYLKSFLAKDIKERPTHLKNLLKLKDFEFIPNNPKKTKISISSLNLNPLSQDIKDNIESRLTKPSCGQELSSESDMEKRTQSSKQSVNTVKDINASKNHPTFIETERNKSDEHSSDLVPSSSLNKINGDTGDIIVETNNRNGQVVEEFEDLVLDDESENFDTNEEEQGNSEQEAISTTTDIHEKSNEIEGIDSVELPREHNLLNEGDDSFVDASNNDFHFISQENDHSLEFGDKEVENKPGNNREIAELEPNKNKAFPTLKEKMLQKLEELKDDIAHIKNARQTHLKSNEIRNESVLNAEELEGVDAQTDTSNMQITTQEFIPSTDLNGRSSSVDCLKENSENLHKTSDASLQELNASDEISEIMKDNGGENTDTNLSAHSSETIILDSVSLPSDSEENSNISDSDLLHDNSNQNIMNDHLNNNENSLDQTCMADMDINAEKKVEDSKPREMSSQASESILNIVPQPSERQNIVVQPTSLFGDNKLFRNLPDLLNLNPHVPTLDEIRSGLSGILGIGVRGADDDDEIEFQSSEDCSSAMSTDASTTKLKSIFPKRPLEDINLDIFQLTPKSHKGLFQSRAPGLNLNSYKAKLALPQNLGLRPLRLESSLGKNGNLLGATLTFGPDRIGSAKSKMSRTSSILDGTRIPTLRSTLPNLPNLGDIKTTMRARAEDLLSSQLPIAAHSHTVQKVSELTDSLRSHTENTVKNLQQTLASSLSESKVRKIPLREKFAKPSHEDLLEKLSTAREDMSDKLKALHADLTDRLSSFHENIAERTTLPTLQLPLFTPINRNSNTKFRTRPKNYSKQKASISNMRSNKGSVSNMRSSASRGTDEIKVRPFKISKAASTLTPKTVEVPKLMTTSSKPPFAKPLQRDSNVKLKDIKPFESSMTVDQKSISKNNLMPIKNRPSSQNKPTLRQQFSSQRATSRAPFAKDTLRNSGSKLNLHDSRGFASELEPAVVPSPVKTAVRVTNTVDPKQTQRTKPRPKPLFTNHNLAIPSQISTPETKLKNNQSFKTLIHKPLSNVTSKPLLSKMRESLLSRHTYSQADDPIDGDAMAGSATENRAIEVRQEPLKENVKYRCRMVCVKEPIE